MTAKLAAQGQRPDWPANVEDQMFALQGVVSRFTATYRSLFPRRWTEDKQAFADFVSHRRVVCVAIYGVKVVSGRSSDDGESVYEVRAMAMTAFGQTLCFKVGVGVWRGADVDELRRVERDWRHAVVALGRYMTDVVPSDAKLSVCVPEEPLGSSELV